MQYYFRIKPLQVIVFKGKNKLFVLLTGLIITIICNINKLML